MFLVGRLDQELGRNDDALLKYQPPPNPRCGGGGTGQAARDRAALPLGLMSLKEAVAALETLTTVWRGDATEAEGLRVLANLYTKEARYRDAFHVMRVALLAHPNSDLTRKIQDEAAADFDLFLSHKGARCRRSRRSACPRLPRVDADRPPRRRMVAGSPTGWWRSTCSTRRRSSCSTRSTTACRARRARRWRRGSPLSISWTTSRTARSPACARRAPPSSTMNCATSGCCCRRGRCPISAVTIWRWRSSRTSRATRRCGCAPISCGPRIAGARRPNRSN